MEHAIDTLRGQALRDRLATARASALESLRQHGRPEVRAALMEIDEQATTAIRTAVAAYESLATAHPAPEPMPTMDASTIAIGDPRGLPEPRRLPSAVPVTPKAADRFEEIVVAAREQLTALEGPLLLNGQPADRIMDQRRAWGHRVAEADGTASRLGVVDHPEFARHPLLAEALHLRARIQTHAVEARERERALQRG